jgi:hypothetical protein
VWGAHQWGATETGGQEPAHFDTILSPQCRSAEECQYNMEKESLLGNIWLVVPVCSFHAVYRFAKQTNLTVEENFLFYEN